MPPKPRTGANKVAAGKTKVGPPKVENSTETKTSSGLSQETEDQFELELCWCIQQLEMCLASGKLQEKQAHDLGKNINVLKNSTAPLIKKRQVMRNTLGNYREKMALDEQKLRKATTSVKFTTSSTPNKSLFVKRASNQSTKERQKSDDVSQRNSENHTATAVDNVQNAFKFNFQISE